MFTYQRECICSSRLFEPQCQSNTALLSRRPSPHMACPSMACAPMPHPPRTERGKLCDSNNYNQTPPVLRARDCVCASVSHQAEKKPLQGTHCSEPPPAFHCMQTCFLRSKTFIIHCTGMLDRFPVRHARWTPLSNHQPSPKHMHPSTWLTPDSPVFNRC